MHFLCVVTFTSCIVRLQPERLLLLILVHTRLYASTCDRRNTRREWVSSATEVAFFVAVVMVWITVVVVGVVVVVVVMLVLFSY